MKVQFTGAQDGTIKSTDRVYYHWQSRDHSGPDNLKHRDYYSYYIDGNGQGDLGRIMVSMNDEDASKSSPNQELDGRIRDAIRKLLGTQMAWLT